VIDPAEQFCFSAERKQREAAAPCYRYHADTVDGLKAYECIICGKRFSRKYTVTRHQMIHQGLRLFRCMLCSKRFNQKSHLVKHHRIHTGERPFECNVCKKAFSQRSTLKRHAKRHHNTKLPDYVRESSLFSLLNSDAGEGSMSKTDMNSLKILANMLSAGSKRADMPSADYSRDMQLSKRTRVAPKEIRQHKNTYPSNIPTALAVPAHRAWLLRDHRTVPVAYEASKRTIEVAPWRLEPDSNAHTVETGR
jgi:uncharacterized Zn-finger protein